MAVLDRITRSGIPVEGGCQELLWKLTLLDIFGKREIVGTGGRNQVLGELGLHDPLLDQLIEDMEIWGPVVLGVTLHPCGLVLKDDDLRLELLIKLLQLFQFAKDVITVENYLLSLVVRLLLFLHPLLHLPKHLK